MAVYNTPSDAANTAVRAFLTAVGELYLKKSFNTASGPGKKLWDQIRKEFEESCAYCGTPGAVQIEHIVMFNRTEFGLHHPGNVIPVCKNCNKRKKSDSGRPLSWQDHLKVICGNDSKTFKARQTKIAAHIVSYEYPQLTDHERHAIRVIAESLYENIKSESNKSLAMYEKLDSAFVKGTGKRSSQDEAN
jgi:hypothetical protein